MKRLLVLICASVCLMACGEDTSSSNNPNNANNTDRPAAIAALTGDAAAGESVYSTNCALCHAADGSGVENLGNDLTVSTYTKEQTIEIILNGTTGVTPAMTAFAGLEDQAIADVTAYSLAFSN